VSRLPKTRTGWTSCGVRPARPFARTQLQSRPPSSARAAARQSAKPVPWIIGRVRHRATRRAFTMHEVLEDPIPTPLDRDADGAPRVRARRTDRARPFTRNARPLWTVLLSSASWANFRRWTARSCSASPSSSSFISSRAVGAGAGRGSGRSADGPERRAGCPCAARSVMSDGDQRRGRHCDPGDESHRPSGGHDVRRPAVVVATETNVVSVVAMSSQVDRRALRCRGPWTRPPRERRPGARARPLGAPLPSNPRPAPAHGVSDRSCCLRTVVVGGPTPPGRLLALRINALGRDAAVVPCTSGGKSVAARRT